MSRQCDYRRLLESRQLDSTPHRLAVLAAVGDSPGPLRAQDILVQLRRTRTINRVTVYRILDLLVEKGLVERMSSGDRSFRYGLSPDVHHRPHAHFYCTRCGLMECLAEDQVEIDTEPLARAFRGVIDKVEIRLDGTCKTCLRRRKGN